VTDAVDRALPLADPITDEELNRLVDAWHLATPGEWYATTALDERDPDTAYGVATGDPASEDYKLVLLTAGGGSFDVAVTNRIDDTELAAWLHNVLPALVARIRTAEGLDV
jgi:hypothetical protein